MVTKALPMPRLKYQYESAIKLKLVNELKLSNVNQAPKIVKVIVSVGLGRGKDDKKLFEVATNTLRKITGRQPIQTAARKSIASFKLREGQPVGLKVTLRNDYMYEFLDRLINVVLPRIRDFHGVSNKSFDKNGNYSIGLPDQSIFPELSFDEVSNVHGLQVTIVSSTNNPEYAKALLKEFGMPFMREER